MLPRFEIRARVSISERRIPVQHATYGAFSITWPAAVQIHWNKRTEELNSHRTGSEQQNDRQCGSHAPGSEIVGTARLRKRDHENQTGGSSLFPDHVVIFSRVFHLRVSAATIWEHGTGYQCGRRFLKWTRSIFTTREFKQRRFWATNVNRKLVLLIRALLSVRRRNLMTCCNFRFLLKCTLFSLLLNILSWISSNKSWITVMGIFSKLFQKVVMTKNIPIVSKQLLPIKSIDSIGE